MPAKASAARRRMGYSIALGYGQHLLVLGGTQWPAFWKPQLAAGDLTYNSFTAGGSLDDKEYGSRMMSSCDCTTSYDPRMHLRIPPPG